MTYKERYGTIENKIQEESKKWLEDINKRGYLFYSGASGKNINLLTKPEIYMNKVEINAKRKAEEHILHLQDCANGNIKPSNIQILEWNYLADKEFPTWRQ